VDVVCACAVMAARSVRCIIVNDVLILACIVRVCYNVYACVFIGE